MEEEEILLIDFILVLVANWNEMPSTFKFNEFRIAWQSIWYDRIEVERFTTHNPIFLTHLLWHLKSTIFPMRIRSFHPFPNIGSGCVVYLFEIFEVREYCSWEWLFYNYSMLIWGDDLCLFRLGLEWDRASRNFIVLSLIMEPSFYSEFKRRSNQM